MARAALVVAILAMSWGSILVRLCVAPPLTIAFCRVLFATLLVAPWGFPGARAAVRRMASVPVPGSVLPAAALAGLFLALHFATWVASLSWTTIAASTLLVSTQPLFAMVLSHRLLGERASAGALLATGVALSGVGLIAWGDFGISRERLAGDLLALLGAVFAAAYLVIGRAVRDRVPFPSYLFLVNLFAALFGGLMAFAAGQPALPERGRDILWLLVMALVPQLLGHGTLNWAVRRMRAYVVNLSVLGEPVLASLYALLIFGEAPPGAVYPGAFLIAAGVVLVLREERRRA